MTNILNYNIFRHFFPHLINFIMRLMNLLIMYIHICNQPQLKKDKTLTSQIKSNPFGLLLQSLVLIIYFADKRN